MPDTEPSLPFPTTPPEKAEDPVAWLQLIRSRRVGPATFFRLMGEYGSAGAALEALPEIARVAGARGYRVCPRTDAEREFHSGIAIGAKLLCHGSADYPQALAEISDAPPILWALGNLDLLKRPCVALVGARNASSLGRRMARKLGGELGEAGFVVASGLARGIDTEAHRASLPTGTIAVFAGGIDVIYPQDNTDLAGDIAREGLILSEMPIGMTPQARHFPRRNRIVSGLSQGVVVVEGAAKSGSLITARDAADQGREVMAVPGHPMDARASGCNMLIRDGATLVRSAADVAEVLAQPLPARPVPGATRHAVPAERPPPGRLTYDLLNLLGPAPVHEDNLIRQLKLPANMVTEALSELDLTGHIERHPGGLVSRPI